MIESAFGPGDVEPAVLPRHHLEAAEWRSVRWKRSEVARICAFQSPANIGGRLFGSKIKLVAGFAVAHARSDPPHHPSEPLRRFVRVPAHIAMMPARSGDIRERWPTSALRLSGGNVDERVLVDAR